MTRFPAAALVFVLLSLMACSGSSPRSRSQTAAPPTDAASAGATAIPTVTFGSTQVHIDGVNGAKTIDVLVATTGAQAARGLGYRDTLAQDSGMLFDMHTVQVPAFWMKGMRFPLDMVWIGDDKRVAGVTADIPPQPGAADRGLKLYASPAPVRFVLELNAGAAHRMGLEAGRQLNFELPAQ